MAGRPKPPNSAPGRRPARFWVLTARRLIHTDPPRPTGSDKEAAHRIGLSHSTVKRHLADARSKVRVTTTAQLVWILAPRLPEPERRAHTDE